MKSLLHNFTPHCDRDAKAMSQVAHALGMSAAARDKLQESEQRCKELLSTREELQKR